MGPHWHIFNYLIQINIQPIQNFCYFSISQFKKRFSKLKNVLLPTFLNYLYDFALYIKQVNDFRSHYICYLLIFISPPLVRAKRARCEAEGRATGGWLYFSPNLYILGLTFLKLASKSVHFHVTICLYTSSNKNNRKMENGPN